MEWFVKKRREVASSLSPHDILLLSSTPEVFRNPDVPYPYRQESYFYYLSGFEYPQSLLILTHEKSVFFLRDRDPKKEQWEGFYPKKEEVQECYGFDEVFYLKDFEDYLRKAFNKKGTLYYNESHQEFNELLLSQGYSWTKAHSLLNPFRLLKSYEEIGHLKKAIEITQYAHQAIAKNLRAGVNERELYGHFIQAFMEKGATREGYGAIIASGNQATTIHYTTNNATCRSGELLLVDAGVEFSYYTADVTRVYPVDGRFSKEQKILYNKVLSLQNNLIQKARPSVKLKDLNAFMQEGVTEILLDLGILKGSLKENLKNNSFFPYCPHNVGHSLGIDVHDPGVPKNQDLSLEASMVFTIEPGIYISKTDKQAPEELRGLGIRIEDDILIQKNQPEVLTASIPKEVELIEELLS